MTYYSRNKKDHGTFFERGSKNKSTDILQSRKNILPMFLDFSWEISIFAKRRTPYNPNWRAMTAVFLTTVLQGDPVSAASLIRETLGSPTGSFAFILGVMLLAGWLIYFVTHHTTKYRTEHEVHKTKVEGVEKSIGDINRDVAYIRGSIDILMKKDNLNPTVQAHSPISLTEYGKKLAIEMELSDKICRNWDKIQNYIDSTLSPSSRNNAYDIQQFCIDTASVALDNFFGSEDLAKTKNYAFQKGNPLIFYGSMIGVMIRDEYFKHKGIDIADVDKHAPTE